MREIFGPVTAILPADSDEEAVGLANATAYGLQATLFTEDVTKAHKYARALKAGTVSVNCFSEGDNTTPFGGYKLSGFGGKDKGRESHDQYTETKTIFLNLDRIRASPARAAALPRRNVPVPPEPGGPPPPRPKAHGKAHPRRDIPGRQRNGSPVRRKAQAGWSGRGKGIPSEGFPSPMPHSNPFASESSPRRAPCTARPRRRAGGGALSACSLPGGQELAAHVEQVHNAAQASIILLFHDLVAARKLLHPLRAGGERLAADAVPGEGVARLREGVLYAPHIGRPRFLVFGSAMRCFAVSLPPSNSGCASPPMMLHIRAGSRNTRFRCVE